jgi:hypothetical protein
LFSSNSRVFASKLLAECGRARWKIGNEHMVLKNREYNLEHTFRRGEEQAGEIYRLVPVMTMTGNC